MDGADVLLLCDPHNCIRILYAVYFYNKVSKVKLAYEDLVSLISVMHISFLLMLCTINCISASTIACSSLRYSVCYSYRKVRAEMEALNEVKQIY